MLETFEIQEDEIGERLDRALARRFPEQSRAYFQALIAGGHVHLNGSAPKKRSLLESGDQLEVAFALTPEIDLQPEPIPLQILYEDEWLIALDKPTGLVVHPGAGNWNGTLVNGLLHHCGQLPGEELRPGIVHRLDKETSGVILAAKSEKARRLLMEQFAKREVRKEYRALVVGNPGNRLIEQPIGRHPKDRKRMAVVPEGREAITECKVLEVGEISSARLFPKTGRTHQLRVHMQWTGTPIVGDPLYGRAAGRLMLHALKLECCHPIFGNALSFEAPLPF